MARGGSSEEEILLQVQGLVSDALAVVSYKWLSRKFSIPSNAAKRLLQTFAELKENSDLHVVYAVCGWSKQEPHSYIIQLVPKSDLEEVKSLLKDSPSVHVYSVQRCLPKDPAQLWSTDFVQSEELYNESPESSNCLRDNRFSAVTCELVQRLSTRGNSRVTSPPPPRLPVSNGAETAFLPSSIPVAKAPVATTPVPSLPPKKIDASPKDVSGGKKPSNPQVSLKTAQFESKESSGPGPTGKRKAPAVTSGNGSSSSLASMWGKAPAKSKVVSPPVAPVPTVAARPPRTIALAGDAEARIQALEAEESSEDDMVNEFTSMRRGQVSNSGGRRRRMIVDDGDNEDGAEGAETETIIRLGTPETPDKVIPAVATATRDKVATNGGASRAQEKSPSPDKENLIEQRKAVKLEPKLGPHPDSKNEINGKNIREVKAHTDMSVPDVPRVVPKRKRVLKTRIDERGREVNEVIWETDGERENVDNDKDQGAKHSASSKQVDVKPPIGKLQAVQKPSTAPVKNAASKPNARTSAKSAGKPGKAQGNIMSFFKKT